VRRRALDDGLAARCTTLRAVDPVTAWSPDALRELRAAVARRDGAGIRAAIEGRDLDQVLQLVGDGLLADPDAELAGECAQRLRRRALDGDAELADALEGATSALRPIAVDLEELGSLLEGDPVRGGGRIDLVTGEIRPGSPYDDPLDLDDEELDDAERWLWVQAGSHDGWRDMAELAAAVPERGLAQRLERAVQGRGAFRRFRAVLDEHPDELTRFHRFADERQRGRARRWLADHGLRPTR
jgi:hypothetical protein